MGEKETMQQIDHQLLQTDHDLLVRLHERFSNFEKNVITMLESANSRIGEVMAQTESKADLRDFSMYKEKTNDALVTLDKRIDSIEKNELVSDTKKEVYIDLASWTWKHWAQIALFITVMASVLKALFVG